MRKVTLLLSDLYAICRCQWVQAVRQKRAPAAPSISSMMTQLGRAAPMTACICTASLIRLTRVVAVRSSLALISSGLYPQCLATTCARVVLPRPVAITCSV